MQIELPPEEIKRLNAIAEEVPIDQITIGDRVRKDFSHVPDLAESIREDGLIQPIVITYDKLLVAGESRIRAHKLLGLSTIRAVYRGVLDSAQLAVLEAKENNDRKALTWQERCLSVDKAHRTKSTEAAMKGESWGMRETGRILGQGKSNIALCVYIAEYLHSNDQEIWKSESAQDAYRILLKRKEDEESALLAKETIPSARTSTAKYTGPVNRTLIPPPSDLFDGEIPSGPSVFTPGISTPSDDGETPGSTVHPPTQGITSIPLSRMLLREENEDSLAVIKSIPPSFVDHVITDWPYAIDMDNLNANNIHGGLKGIETVAKEHDVEKNLSLQTRIIPEIFRVLRPNGFFITWMDIMHWNATYTACIEAGFAVQRWPLVWHKTGANMNQAAQANFTKNFEVAIVCRKGTACLVKPQPSSIWTGSNDVEAKALGHPFTKPFGLWQWLYDAVAIRGSTILDPFVGSGSSTIPAIRSGMKPIGIECNELHYNRLVVNISSLYKSLDPNVTFE